MPQATITVQAKQSPAIGKKQGKIQDTTGSLWNVWGDKLQNYREGVTYDITYDEQEFNDKRYNLITKGNPSNGSSAAPPIQAAHRGLAQPKPADGWPGPVTNQPNAKDEMIFVCGVINNAMANANVNPFETTLTELIAMVDKARSAWRNTLGKSQRDHELNDDLPV